MPEVNQYSSAKPLLGSLATWIPDTTEQMRLGAYALYEAIYWCVPDTFKLVSRGAEDRPIYVPAGRVIVETLQRYMANDMTIIADPIFGTPNDQALATQVMTDLVRRERLYSKFNMNKRYGIMRGDWLWHIYADPARPPGSKISVFPIDPSSVFKITNPDNVDEVIGYYIAEQQMVGDKVYIRRQSYLKTTGTGGPSTIDYADALFEVDKWFSLEDSPINVPNGPELNAALTLPGPIDSLPIYHIPNFNEPNALWGSSEMRGLERIMAAVNQSISDEEIALALEGLGVYTTDSGTPVNEAGEEVPWNLGPGRVVELPDGKSMNRVAGLSSVTPYQDHLSYLHKMLDEAASMSAVAKGSVDVQVAESGVALQLELAPLLSRAAEREQIVTDVMTNMLYDLAKWYIAYEGTAFNSLLEVSRWIPKYGTKVPVNVAKQVEELLTLATAKPQIVSMSYVRNKLRTLGYDDMPDETTMAAEILAETQATAQITADVTGARVDEELTAELNGQAALASQN
jgi:hypothetical protein